MVIILGVPIFRIFTVMSSHFDLFGDVSFHFHVVRWCNVVFSHQKHMKYRQTPQLQSKFWRDFFSCNGGKLATSKGYTCLFVVSCMLESK